MASAQAEELKALYRGWVAQMGANPAMSLEEMRRMFEHWGDVTAEPGGIDYVEVQAGSVPALWATPKNARTDCVLLCTHGGGYIVGSMFSHRKLFGHIAKAVGCRALILNYRCAPEHVHPAPVDDVAAAYRWLLDRGIKPSKILMTGDSAGGALAISGMLRLREQGLPLPAGSMPMSPWVDMEVVGETIKSNAQKDALVSYDVAYGMSTTFLGEGGNRRDPLANPLFADLKGLPPLFIQAGGDETLLDDSRRLVERARAAGVEVTFEIHPEMQHVFHVLAGTAPEADAAIAGMAKWAKKILAI